MKTNEELLNFYNVEIGKEYEITDSRNDIQDELQKLVGRKFVVASAVFRESAYMLYVKIYKDDVNEKDPIYKNINFLSEIDYKEIKNNNSLNSKEKEYLSTVIKPFRDKIINIIKSKDILNDNDEYIRIKYEESENIEVIIFPSFPKDTMYKGMKLDEEYTLEELGL